MSKQTINFTKAKIDGLPLSKADQRDTYNDTKTAGLQLRVTGSGVKTFSVFRWVKAEGKPERITLGRYPDMSIEQARDKAASINAAIANRQNPNNAIRAERQEMTFKQLFDEYKERWAKPHKKSWKEDENNYRRYIERCTRISPRKLSKISRADIAALHAEIGKRHKPAANRVLTLISSIFGRAIEWGVWNSENPARGIRKFPETPRDRFIQSDELPVFFEALAHDPSEMMQDYFMLLLLTGVRRANLMAMRWAEISFERKEWRIPETKNGTSQVISLDDGHGAIMRILENRKNKIKADEKDREAEEAKESQKDKNEREWVFASVGKTGHLVEPHKGWERLLARAELFRLVDMVAKAEKWKADRLQKTKVEANGQLEESLKEYHTRAKKLRLEANKAKLHDLRIHDLRRTLGSWMAGTGASTVMIGRQLNQKSEAATRIYSRLQLDPVTEARNKAVSAMFGTVGMGTSAQILNFKKA
jgi:integrase